MRGIVIPTGLIQRYIRPDDGRRLLVPMVHTSTVPEGLND
jgi:hypothetical protein